MNKKIGKNGWIVIAVVILIILIGIWAFNQPRDEREEAEQEEGGEIAQEDSIESDPFQDALPDNIVVPDIDMELTEEEAKIIAIPNVVSAAAPGVEAKFRSFDVVGEGGRFVPSNIIVNKGDTVHINFTAVDRDYDIQFPSYGMKQFAKIGQTKILEFQAVTAGNFIYYCESCGGIDSTARGNIIVSGEPEPTQSAQGDAEEFEQENPLPPSPEE